MDSPSDDSRNRVKFLCSYGGSILPRPHDGKLRYVGGDTRIVCVPRDISYAEMLDRMQELFDGVSVIKYQQPDEDLDALVSVVNDDDVISMMEEYDKVGLGGDGCTRLRIFLFSSCIDMDVDSVAGYFDSGERESERRYVDALNSFPEIKSPASPDLPEQLFGQLSVDVGNGNHASLHHLTIPHAPRYGEMDANWNPGYYSPGNRVSHDPREFPLSPSYHFGAVEFNDRILDDHARQVAGYQLRHYNHLSPPPVDTMMWVPVGTENAGFPNNLGHQHNFGEGNNVCESCRMSFQRKQGVAPETRFIEPHRKHGQSYLEQASTTGDYTHFPNSYAQCYPSPYMVNQDLILEHGSYVREQREFHRATFNEPHIHSQGWAVQGHHIGQRLDDTRIHHPGTSRPNEQYIITDGNTVNNPFKPADILDGHLMPSNCMVHEELQWLHRGNENGDENLVPQQTFGVSMYANSSVPDETTGQYVNQPPTHGLDSLYQVPRNLSPIPSLRRQAQVKTRPVTPHDKPGVMIPNGASIAGHVRHTQEGHPRLHSEWIKNDPILHDLLGQHNSIPQKQPEFKEPVSLYYLHGNGGESYVPTQGSLIAHAPDSVPSNSNNFQMKVFPDTLPPELVPSDTVSSVASIYQNQKPPAIDYVGVHEYSLAQIEKESDQHSINASTKQKHSTEIDLHGLKVTEAEGCANKLGHADDDVACENREISDETLRFLPELIASAQKAVLDGAEEVIAKEQENPEGELPAHCSKEQLHECIPENACAEVEAQSDGDGQQVNLSKIEPTTAEDEALANGLQTIKNEDLEEIRALGSGTYGSVFYGKWRGSDVAIKRIKASCFAGKPSERARLIADFWKEALLMSKLHHPNIVSFYGVVRDGPDGSLATVTEFMVNGSLKQFLRKKDRTIDRRKRLIIAMDVAFGMEYLHGKNIVHFDLKCENLLVNMRDPHRPICKIGDLGLSKVKQHTLVSGGIRGTLPWMAPELLNGKSSKVSEKIDVYSFGIVMWELLTGEEPYADIRGAAIIGGIINNTLRPNVPTWCDPEWRSLMECCWSSDPELRPSFSEISCKLRNMAAAINLK